MNMLKFFAGVNIAEKDSVIEIWNRFKVLEQVIDIPIDPRAAIIAGKVEQVRIDRYARLIWHGSIIPRCVIVRSAGCDETISDPTPSLPLARGGRGRGHCKRNNDIRYFFSFET